MHTNESPFSILNKSLPSRVALLECPTTGKKAVCAHDGGRFIMAFSADNDDPTVEVANNVWFDGSLTVLVGSSEALSKYIASRPWYDGIMLVEGPEDDDQTPFWQR